MCTGTSWLVFYFLLWFLFVTSVLTAYGKILPHSAGVPGVLSVLPDKNFESLNKDYGGIFLLTSLI